MIPENHYICDGLSIHFSGENKISIMPINSEKRDMIMIKTTWNEVYNLLLKEIKE